MKNNMLRKSIATATIIMLLTGSVAMAATPIYSKPFRLPAALVRPVATEAPVAEQPAEEQPTEEQPTVEQPTVEQPAEEQPAVEQPAEEQPAVEQPTEEQPAVEQPTVEQPKAAKPEVKKVTPAVAAEEAEAAEAEPEEAVAPITYVRDEKGALVLDENGNPIPVLPEGADIPVTYVLDEGGALVLDENGDPIVKESVPAGSTLLGKQQEVSEENVVRSAYIYVVTPQEEILLDAPVTLQVVLEGYEGLSCSFQWQCSPDNEIWEDVEGETDPVITFMLVEANNYYYWRIAILATEEEIG